MLKRFYSTNHKQIESAIYIIGHAATRISRSVNAEVNLRKIVQDGPKALSDKFLSRKISPTQLIGTSDFLGTNIYFSYFFFSNIKYINLFLDLINKAKELIEIREKMKQIDFEIESVSKTPASEEYQKNAHKKLIHELRGKNKKLKTKLWDLEEQTIIPILKLPNDLEPDTPTGKAN